ncbi:MAG TPA: ATP-binding protein, partial [Burkholderiales bacterium]|nr:ATP-binding protein [Burkholderiales bacterium]
ESNKVDFRIDLDPALQRSMFTDIKRMQQIIKNLLSNAFKFTHQGSVSLTVKPVTSGWSSDNDDLNAAGPVVAFSVSDTGIGIAPEKQQLIFEAFQQADGSTSRKYGGTGLGLAISRELSKLLGGEIRLVSAPGVGSTFTLYLPVSYVQRNPRLQRPVITLEQAQHAVNQAAAAIKKASVQENPIYEEAEVVLEPNEAGDDRSSILPGDSVVLIVENDLAFAKVLLDAARREGFKGLVSGSAASALSMIKEYQPSVLTLDIFLPDMQGWRILDRLKADLSTRHIPVCVVSTDDSRDRALTSGAIGFISKPVKSGRVIDEAMQQLKTYISRPRRNLALLMPAGAERNDIIERLKPEEVDVIASADSAEICKALREQQVDCLVVRNGSGDLQPADLVDILEQQAVTRQLPIIQYGAEGTGTLGRWQRGDGVFALREARSPERLMDYIYFFLHRSVAGLSAEERQKVEALHNSSRVLEGRKALIVDDDMRNIFALSTVLHDQGM